MAALIESIPNFSEGRRGEVIEEIVARARATADVRVLEVSSDPTHNRSSVSMVGEAGPLAEAVLAMANAAIERIDLTSHSGEHPRIGAVDVVPFVPIRGATMEDCVALARRVGGEIAKRHAVPVFLYEEAAASDERRPLAALRKGEFEGLALKLRDPRFTPDFGPATPHPTAGATAVGARPPLLSVEILLGTDRLDVAERVAAALRGTSGGFATVRASVLRGGSAGSVRVSVSVSDFRKTPLHRVFELARSEAERHGVRLVGCEILGLVPAAALLDVAAHHLRLVGFEETQVLESRLSGV